MIAAAILLFLSVLLMLRISLSIGFDGRKLSGEISYLFLRFPLGKGRKKQGKVKPKTIMRCLSRKKGRLRVECFAIDYTAAGAGDPFDAVTEYNIANALVSGLLVLISGIFEVRNQKININTDINADESTLAFNFGISLRLWQALHLYYTILRELKKSEASHGKQGQRYDGVRHERNTEAC